MSKASVEQIRERFDKDVERFSNLETGNMAQVDSLLSLELIAEAAAATTPQAKAMLDVGCGAGNYTLKLLERLPNMDVALNDLSLPMLEKARERISAVNSGTITLMQGDIRDLDIGTQVYDVIVASAVLHHLREESEWRLVFGKLYTALHPGGSLWIYDLIEQSIPELNPPINARYGDYLTQFKDESYRDQVMGWIEREDSPRPLMFQLDLLRAVGFRDVDVLHKHLCFAAFGGRK
jgi:tRNA (cmo5U34)-methyltransferase